MPAKRGRNQDLPISPGTLQFATPTPQSNARALAAAQAFTLLHTPPDKRFSRQTPQSLSDNAIATPMNLITPTKPSAPTHQPSASTPKATLSPGDVEFVNSIAPSPDCASLTPQQRADAQEDAFFARIYPPFEQPDFVKDTEEEVAGENLPLWSDDDEERSDDDEDMPHLLSESDTDSDSDEDYNSAEDAEDDVPLDTLRNKLIMRKKKMNMPSGHERRNLLHLPHDKTAIRMFRSTRPDNRSERCLSSCDNDHWTVTAAPNQPKMAVITERKGGKHTNNRSFTVPDTRVLKAMKLLAPEMMVNAMLPTSCTCKRECHRHLTFDLMTNARLEVASATSEAGVGELLTGKLRATPGKYTVNNRECCQMHFAAVYGVYKPKVKLAFEVANGSPTAAPFNTRDVRLQHPAPQRTLCWTFWTTFFDMYCQQPNDDERLFPTEKTLDNIYEEYFKPWCHAQGVHEGLPGISLFKKTRWHEDFKNVKKQKNHNHCRCNTCANLKAKLFATFLNPADYAEVKQVWRTHDTAVKAWRDMEAHLKAQAKTNPHEVIVICHDATQAMGFPRVSNRPNKNLTKTRFNWVPWLAHDLGRDRYDYVYMPKGRWKKDANFLCTMMQALIFRAKTDYTHPNHQARRAVWVADNGPENKNNEVLAFCCDLVTSGLLDCVELLFGEVGHTHNGVDAAHSIHNRSIGKFVSGDIGHFVRHYPYGFHKHVPSASILTQVYDWKRYYDGHLRKLSGYTKTQADNAVVRGWRIARNAQNEVEVRWKADPAMDKYWRGQDGGEHSAGFTMFNSMPTGVPPLVKPKEAIMQPEHLAELKGKMFQEVMDAQRLGPCVMWNYNAAKNGGEVPMTPTEDEIPMGQWGKTHLVGAIRGKQGIVRVVEKFFGGDTRATMFAPTVGANQEHLVATGQRFHFSGDGAILEGRQLPNLRYANQPATASLMYKHSNNVAHRNNRNKKRKQPPADDAAEHHEEKSDREEKSDEPDQEPLPDYVQGGDWNASEGNQFFELDFKKCIVGKMFVSKVIFEDGQDGIQVGKILTKEPVSAQEPRKMVFTGKMLACTKPCFMKACLSATWNPTGQVETIHNWQVLAYFSHMNKNKTFPATVAKILKGREDIEWKEVEPQVHD